MLDKLLFYSGSLFLGVMAGGLVNYSIDSIPEGLTNSPSYTRLLSFVLLNSLVFAYAVPLLQENGISTDMFQVGLVGSQLENTSEALDALRVQAPKKEENSKLSNIAR